MDTEDYHHSYESRARLAAGDAIDEHDCLSRRDLVFRFDSADAGPAERPDKRLRFIDGCIDGPLRIGRSMGTDRNILGQCVSTFDAFEKQLRFGRSAVSPSGGLVARRGFYIVPTDPCGSLTRNARQVRTDNR